MKHVKKVSRSNSPAKAFIWEWFVNTKTTPWTAGTIQAEGKPGYVNDLWGSCDSIDPNDPNDF